MSAELITEELLYLSELKSTKEKVQLLFRNEIQDCHMNAVKELTECLELICDYHDARMTPDLCARQNDQDVVSYFIKHKELFYLYEDIFKYEPYVVVYSEKYLNDSASIRSSLRKLSKHLENYFVFLTNRQRNNQTQRALNIVEKALQEQVDSKNSKYVIAEIIMSEAEYIKKLEFLIQNVYPLINNSKYIINIRHICGKTEDICRNQKLFYEDLLNCVYDSNINRVMDCFMRHEKHLTLYGDDVALKSDSNLINNFKRDCQVPPEVDITLTKTRLLFYRNCLERIKKITAKSEKEAVAKVEKVETMIKEILNKANDNMQDIFGANIYMETVGPLKESGIFKIKPSSSSSSEEFSGEVYLFEKYLVLTRGIYQEPNKSHIVNSYEGHIITSHLGCNYQRNQKMLQVYFQEKLQKKYIYNLTCEEEEILQKMNGAIEQLLWDQVDKANKLIKSP